MSAAVVGVPSILPQQGNHEDLGQHSRGRKAAAHNMLGQVS